ncbi:MAG: amidohydrolase, partial [Candidatus Bathyarchaeia archaeon]
STMSLEPCPRAIVGGTLIDGTGRQPLKDSVVVLKDEWIEAVGKRGEVSVPDGAELVDASGKTVIPGLIDAHMHFLGMGMRMIRTVNLSDTRSVEEAMENVKRKVAETRKGDWVLGGGWDESKWVEKRYLTKYDLDPFSKDNPVLLSRICGHLLTLNSKALEIANITKDTPNPPGGRVDKNEEGEPTGVLRDAGQLVWPHVPSPSEEMALDGLRRACDYALILGCTGIHEAGMDAFGVRAYQKAAERGFLKVRTYIMWRAVQAGSMEALGLRTGFGNDMLRLGSAKLLIDGSLGARTAALFEPYEDDPSTRGLTMMSVDELKEKVKTVHRQGSQVAIHAIGDYGIELAINAIEEAIKDSPRKDHRHRIEHCEILTSTQIERIRQLGIVASVQPNFVGEWSWPEGLYETRLGRKRLRQNNPYRLLLDEGVHVAFGSDGMPFKPIYGIWSAVSHPIRESRITLEEAIKCYTLDSAFASFEEDIKGSIEPGKLADITILEEDLSEIPTDKIKDVSVHMTIIGGKILYSKN